MRLQGGEEGRDSMFSALDRLLVYVHYSVQSRKKWGVNLLQTEKSIGRSCKVKLGKLTIYRSNTVHCSVCRVVLVDGYVCV